MDAGIIMSFKRHYCHLHINWILKQVEAGNDIKNLKMDVLQAIKFIIESWKEVSPQTIYNCWHHTKILPDRINVNLSNFSDDINDPTTNQLSQAVAALNLNDAMSIQEYLNNPEEKSVYKVPDDDNIIEALVEMYKQQPEIDTNDFEEDDSVEQVLISTSEASKSLEIVRTFLLQQENSSQQIKMVNSLDRYISLKTIKTMRQSTMESYLNQ
jgi:hypothetical protein